jgi:glycosyltransferase involved in cell wall biosynthesis
MCVDDITVVIPTQNRVDYLMRALKSASANSWQIIVVDDGSIMPTAEVLQHANRADFTILRNKYEKGAAAARNFGCESVQTEWILYLDDDDRLMPGAEQLYIDAVQSNPAVDVWFGGTHHLKTGHQVGLVARSQLGRRNILGGCSGVLIRKSVLDQAGGFDAQLPSMQDWDLWIRLFRIAKLHHLGKYTVVYEYESPDKITHNLHFKYCGLLRVLRKHRNFFTVDERHFHIRRLLVLRLLLEGHQSLLGNWIRMRGWPFALYYTYRWRKHINLRRE